MPHPFKTGQLLGVDVDHVAWLSPLVTVNWLHRLQIPEPYQTHRFEPAPSGGQQRSQGFGDTTHGATLVT